LDQQAISHVIKIKISVYTIRNLVTYSSGYKIFFSLEEVSALADSCGMKATLELLSYVPHCTGIVKSLQSIFLFGKDGLGCQISIPRADLLNTAYVQDGQLTIKIRNDSHMLRSSIVNPNI
jgi:hypothetical protein